MWNSPRAIEPHRVHRVLLSLPVVPNSTGVGFSLSTRNFNLDLSPHSPALTSADGPDISPSSIPISPISWKTPRPSAGPAPPIHVISGVLYTPY